MALEHCKALFDAGAPVTVCYFGGSITEGAGVSDPALSWRELSAAWLAKTFSSSAFTFVNASIGGTGSAFGMYRAANDCFSHEPDLVIIEYAVNDSVERSFETVAHYMEGIVRQALSLKKVPDLLIVFTMTKDSYLRDRAGDPIFSYPAHRLVASHYGIPTVDLGNEIGCLVDAGKKWEDYTVDTVHPNEIGYALYASKFEKDFLSLLADDTKTVFAPPLFDDSFSGGEILDAFSSAGLFRRVDKSLCGRYPHYVEGENPGDALIFEGVIGSSFGLFYENFDHAGDILITIDGKDYGKIRLWDEYAKSFSRGHFLPLVESLPEAPHTVVLTIAKEKSPESLGTTVRIAALLIGHRDI